MTTNDILNQAIELIKTGEKAAARKLLESYLQTNPQDVTAWVWQARAESSLEARIKVLETCLTYNPSCQEVGVVLAALNTQRNRPTGVRCDPSAPAFAQWLYAI